MLASCGLVVTRADSLRANRAADGPFPTGSRPIREEPCRQPPAAATTGRNGSGKPYFVFLPGPPNGQVAVCSFCTYLRLTLQSAVYSLSTQSLGRPLRSKGLLQHLALQPEVLGNVGHAKTAEPVLDTEISNTETFRM